MGDIGILGRYMGGPSPYKEKIFLYNRLEEIFIRRRVGVLRKSANR